MTANHNFSAIVSLGRACDTSHQIRRYFGQPASFPFDWLITPDAALTTLITQDFLGFLDEAYLQRSPGGIIDAKLGVEFLHDFETPDQFQAALPEVREKYQRRIERWREQMQRGGKILFVRGCQYLNNDNIGLETARALLALLQASYGNAECHLLVVNPVGVAFPEFQEPRLSLLTIQPPEPFVWSGDDAAWDRVFTTVLAAT